MTPSTPAICYWPKCDCCMSSPCSPPSTPAPTAAGALADRVQQCIDCYPVDTIGKGLLLEVVAALRNSAPQETRGDEPVAWRCRSEDGFYTAWFDGKPPKYYGPYEVAYRAHNVASQQHSAQGE